MEWSHEGFILWPPQEGSLTRHQHSNHQSPAWFSYHPFRNSGVDSSFTYYRACSTQSILVRLARDTKEHEKLLTWWIPVSSSCLYNSDSIPPERNSKENLPDILSIQCHLRWDISHGMLFIRKIQIKESQGTPP